MINPAKADSHKNKSSKRAINLSLSVDVLDAAKSLDVNVSQVCDQFLRNFIQQELLRRWKVEHADFVEAYNASVKNEGLPLDQWRTF
ncbi:MAG: type II toxin-antitoxin system CcdA family antitoxin [Limnobacter sp.]|nr:type II toxin-antitoxin system CcdA family antitoxin [Limnobacter sp.]